MTSFVPVILCGGSGSRLWPLSRSGFPKQLLPLLGEQSMLQATVTRLSALGIDSHDPVVSCNEAQRFLVAAQLQQLDMDARLIVEPEGRNTAPAISLAALLLNDAGSGDTPMLVLPADHVIADCRALAEAVGSGIAAAKNGKLVTFGIVPSRPETGYGYIHAEPGGDPVRRVQSFVEKPDATTAAGFVESGEYYWNSGMFLFTPQAWLRALSAHAPQILEACRQAFEARTEDADFLRPEPAAFKACPADSIDYAVMEKTAAAAVVPLDAGWSDVGSWASLHDASPVDDAGNFQSGDVSLIDCKDSYVRAESRLVAAVGLQACVVVETADAVLVVPKERAQDVKHLVDSLAGAGRAEVHLGREVFRPWGSFDSLDSRPGYQVKRLTVLPGAILSLQLHHRRAEHWVVVAGTARITLEDEVFDLGKNEHVFIPVEARHRIENPGPELLHIIEVQVGDYLGEDDIVRFDDRYGRQGRTD